MMTLDQFKNAFDEIKKIRAIRQSLIKGVGIFCGDGMGFLSGNSIENAYVNLLQIAMDD